MSKLTSYNKKIISSSYVTSDVQITNASVMKSGLEWNMFIAPYIDIALHEQLLKFTGTDAKIIYSSMLNVLSLIRSGYFYTASVIVAENIDILQNDEMKEIATWLIKTLREADDT